MYTAPDKQITQKEMSRSKDTIPEIPNLKFEQGDSTGRNDKTFSDAIQQREAYDSKKAKSTPEEIQRSHASRSVSPLDPQSNLSKQSLQINSYKNNEMKTSPSPKPDDDDEPLQKQNTANFGLFVAESPSLDQILIEAKTKDEKISPSKYNNSHTQLISPTTAANNKIIKERLGIETFEEMEELFIQMQGYSGAAAANVGNSEQRQMLKFKDLYQKPQIIGQGAFGVVVRVDKNNIQNRTPTQKHFSSHQPYQGRDYPGPPLVWQNQQSVETDSSSPLTPKLLPSASSKYANIVAVKVINKKEINESGYQVLKNEALILKEMDHPNIVKFYDIFETNEFIFIEMEYITNGTLRNLMQSGKRIFTDYEVSQIIGGLLSAVHHVHSKNYVHRDLKPENVLIGDPDSGRSMHIDSEQTEEDSALKRSIKLADFGLSASFRISQAHSLDERMGTLLFMAPEQTKNQNYGKKIDIWAMGIIMYQLLQGKHPLYISGVDNNQTYLEKLVKCKPAKWVAEDGPAKNFTSMSRDFFTKLCNPMPIERYTAEQALRHPWITRNFDTPIPQTESQKVRDVQAESLLRNAVSITFFLSVAKLRRNNRSVDPQHSQQSTSSSSCSLEKSSLSFNISEYMARCERVIIESEERDQKRREAINLLKDPPRLPLAQLSDDSPTVKISEAELIENFDEVRSQATPIIKKPKNDDNLVFEFNTSNLKKSEVDNSQVLTNKKASVNTSTIKRISNFTKKISGVTSQSQPQQVKKAQIHYQQLFTDSTDQQNQQDGSLPGCLIQGVGQIQVSNKKKGFISQNQEEASKQQSHSVSPITKRISNFHAATDDKRNTKNLQRSESQQSESELRIDDQSKKAEESKKPKGFQLNLQRLEQQLDNDMDDDLLEPQFLVNRTPNDLEKDRLGDYSGLSVPSQIMYTNKPQKLKTSKIQSSKIRQNDLGTLLQPDIGNAGLYQLGQERQSLTELVSKMSPDQKYKLSNPQSQSQQPSLKKKRTLVGVSSQLKPKKISDFELINENIKLYEIGGTDGNQQKIPITSFGHNGQAVTYLIDDSRQLQLQLKSALQNKSLTKQGGGGGVLDQGGLQLPMIGKSDDSTNRRLGPLHLGQEGNQSIKKTKNGGKAQRSLENTGQRTTHNFFYNQQQHSLQIPYHVVGFEGVDPSTLINYQHSFAVQGPQGLVDARRQSMNNSVINNNHINQQQLDTFFNILPGTLSKNVGEQQLTKQMTSAEFYQFHQKYQQWKEQRSSIMLPKQGGGQTQQPLAVELQRHLAGTIKQVSQKAYQVQQQTGVIRPNSKESDEFMLMAAKGAATLKQQKSSANVIQSHGPGASTQNDLELSPSKSIFQTSVQDPAMNLFASESKALRATRFDQEVDINNFSRIPQIGKGNSFIQGQFPEQIIPGQQIINRGKSYNNKMMPQHQHIIGGAGNIIKNASVMVTSLANANAVRTSELGISFSNQTRTKRTQNDISSSQIQIVGNNPDGPGPQIGVPLSQQAKNYIIAQKMQSVQSHVIQKAKRSR